VNDDESIVRVTSSVFLLRVAIIAASITGDCHQLSSGSVARASVRRKNGNYD
jgi:hypothetical protein